MNEQKNAVATQDNSSFIIAGSTPSAAAPRFLIIRSGAIGDTLRVTPLIRAARRTFPQAEIFFLASKAAHDVVRYNPHLNRTYHLHYRRLPIWASPEKWRLLRELGQHQFDAVLVLETHPSFLELAERLAAKRLIAFARPPNDKWQQAHFQSRQNAIINTLNAGKLIGVEPDGFDMDLPYPARFDAAIKERLSRAGIGENDLLIGIHAGWGRRNQHPTKTRLRGWPADRFAEVVRWLVEKVGAKVVLTGSPLDRRLVNHIAAIANAPTLNLAGQLSLLEMAALLRSLKLFVTTDTGPSGMALALNTPQVVLWGPGILAETGLIAGENLVQLLHHPIPCAPCYGTKLQKTCRDNVCMKKIETAEVKAAIEEKLRIGP